MRAGGILHLEAAMGRFGRVLLMAACLTAAVASQAQAGALWLYEQATPDQGTSAAGRAALARDASTAYGNPAGMTRLDRTQFLLGAGALVIQSDFRTEPGTNKSGGGSDLSSALPVLTSYFVYSATQDFKLGVSLTPLMGAILDYGDTYAGRYYNERTALVTLNFNPVAAYRLTNWLSVGAGMSVVGGYLASKTAINNPDPALRDGRLEMHSLTVGFGGNAGILVEPRDGTRFGITYRSPVNLNFNNIVQSTRGLGPGLTFLLDIVGQKLGVPRGSPVDITLTNPQEVMFSAYHELTDKLAVMGNFGWQNWKAFGHVDFTINGDKKINDTANLHLADTYHWALGAQYRVAPSWLVMAGFAYDTSPVVEGRRTLATALDRQFRYSAGVLYDLNKDLTLGAAYTLIDMGDAPFNQQGGPLTGNLVGHYAPNLVHVVGFNLSKRF